MLHRHTFPLSLAVAGALLVPLSASAENKAGSSQATKQRTATNRAPQKPHAAPQKPHTEIKRVRRSEQKATSGSAIISRRRTVVAHFAGDPSDTISDFMFSPATITIHVGDTVTWTNNGPTAHTATANNGSFDTGPLQKGQSASHTFSSAGTFAYICSIHPFMHGTVVVLGSSSGSGTGSGNSGTSSGSGSSGSSTSGSSSNGSSSSSNTSTGSATGTSSSPSLPNTGSNLLATILTGALLAGGGLLLRRRLALRSSRD